MCSNSLLMPSTSRNVNSLLGYISALLPNAFKSSHALIAVASSGTRTIAFLFNFWHRAWTMCNLFISASPVAPTHFDASFTAFERAINSASLSSIFVKQFILLLLSCYIYSLPRRFFRLLSTLPPQCCFSAQRKAAHFFLSETR